MPKLKIYCLHWPLMLECFQHRHSQSVNTVLNGVCLRSGRLKVPEKVVETLAVRLQI